MKIGDTITDLAGKTWLVYDFSDLYIYCTDLETHKLNHVIGTKESFSIEPKPANVEYLFIKRRESNMRGLKYS